MGRLSIQFVHSPFETESKKYFKSHKISIDQISFDKKKKKTIKIQTMINCAWEFVTKGLFSEYSQQNQK